MATLWRYRVPHPPPSGGGWARASRVLPQAAPAGVAVSGVAALTATAAVTASGAVGRSSGATLTVTAAAAGGGHGPGFLTQVGNTLQLDGQTVKITGVNVYGSALSTNVYTNLNAVYTALGTPGTDGRGQVIRFWAFQRAATVSGVRDWTKLDNVVATAAARGFKLIPVLVNTGANDEDPTVAAATSYWADHGGGEFYRTPLWYQSGYNSQILSAWTVTALDWVAEIAARYKNSSTIAMWEIHNEMESGAAPDSTPGVTLLTNYTTAMGAAIKAADPNHLVTTSVVGTGQDGSSGGDFATVFGSSGVDVVQIHDYSPQGTTLPGDQFNGMALRIMQADLLGKPIMVGEIGTIIGSTEAPTMADRAVLWQQKVTTQFRAGLDGWIIWSYIEPPGGTPYDVGFGDPALAVPFVNGGVVSRWPVASYRYFRFTPTAVRGPSTSIVALSEFQMFGPDGLIMGATATATAGNNSPGGEGPAQAVDNDTGTKWLNLNGIGAGLVLDYGAAVDATGYRYATGGDATERDPIGWTLEGSNDNSTWQPLDTRSAQTITTSRAAYTDIYQLSFVGAALTATAAVTATGAVTRTGAATLTVAAAVSATGATTRSSTAALAVVAATAAAGSAALDRGANPSAAATITPAGSAGRATGAALAAAAAVTAAGLATSANGASLSAAATVTASGQVAVSGAGLRTATAVVSAAGQTSTASGVTLIVTGAVSPNGAAGASGTATLISTATIGSTQATTTGSGTAVAALAVIAAGGTVGRSSAAAVASTAFITATSTGGASGAAVAAAVALTPTGSTGLSGTASLTATAAVGAGAGRQSGAVLTATATMTPTISLTAAGAAAVSTTAAVAAVGAVGRGQSAALAVTASVTTGQVTAVGRTGSLTASAAVSATGTVSTAAGATTPVTAVVGASGSVLLTRTAAITATAQVTAVGVTGASAAGVLNAQATVTVTGQLTGLSSPASVTVAAGVSTTGVSAGGRPAAMVIAASWVVTGYVGGTEAFTHPPITVTNPRAGLVTVQPRRPAPVTVGGARQTSRG